MACLCELLTWLVWPGFARDACTAAPVAYSEATFQCTNGETIKGSFVNDNFCDCGNDEPGTGACADQPFVCPNVGATPKAVHASLVGDGLCDCCDGSDEWQTATQCFNTCMEEENRLRYGVYPFFWRLKICLCTSYLSHG